jgi:ABC-type dipeptide/oligopeptide/nickel transport system permease subunit
VSAVAVTTQRGRALWGAGSGFALAGAGLVVALSVVAVLAPVLAPYDPHALSGAPLQPPSAAHPVGTNNIGQDLLSQLVWGTRASMAVALGSAALALVIGVLVGIGAGLRGGLVDTVAMRVVDAFLAVPVLPLLIVVAAAFGPSRVTIIVVIGVMLWPAHARVVRSQALTLRQRGFVQAARGLGGGLGYVLRRHLVPALGSLVAAGFVNVAAIAALLEAGLAFLGLADPTGTSWGLVLNRALQHQGVYFSAAWLWWVLPAGGAITVAVLGFTFLGVGLEPAFNPRAAATPERAAGGG